MYTSNLHTKLKLRSGQSINNKLDLLVTLHNEIKDLCLSLEFAHTQIIHLKQSNNSLQTTIKALTENMDLVMKENKMLKEIILDIQTGSMRTKPDFLQHSRTPV